MTEWVILTNGQTTATLYCGDCLEILPMLEKVDAVVTDPPYGVKVADWDSDMPPQEVLSLCLNVARGPVMWFGSAPRILDFAKYDPRPDRILIWAPAFTLSKLGKDGYLYRYHPIALWRPVKQTAIFGDVIRVSCGRHYDFNHPATKPEELMMPLVAASGGQSVLDPFMGSGTTGVACAKLGRNFIGIELCEEYFNIAVKRIRAALSQPQIPFDSKSRCDGNSHKESGGSHGLFPNPESAETNSSARPSGLPCAMGPDDE